jgi:hypothetical protein
MKEKVVVLRELQRAIIYKIVYWFVNGYQSGYSFCCLITVLLGHL